VPGVSPAAKQMGECAARNVLHRMRGEDTHAFRYRDYGALATIGRRAAVAMVGPFRFSGFFAWVFWLFVHIYFLIGYRNRLVVLTDWAWAYFTFERYARIFTHGPKLPSFTASKARMRTSAKTPSDLVS
jgi:NADH dehydrogenase